MEEGFTIETFPDLPSLPDSSEAKICQTKLPNIMKVETHPFDKEVFDIAANSASKTTEQIQMDCISEECAIRWREVKDENGDIKRESNARFVEWSDGSVQLFIGDKIVFNVEKRDTSEEHNYLYSVINSGSSLTCQAKLEEKIALLPGNKYTSDLLKISMTLSTSMQLSRDKKVITVYNVSEKSKEVNAQIMKNRKQIYRKEKQYKNSTGVTAAFLQHNTSARDDYDEDDDDEEDDEIIDRLNNPLNRYALDRQRKRTRGNEQERENRILNAKSGRGASPVRKKKQQHDEDEFDSDENLDEEEDEKSINKGRRGFLVGDDEEDEDIGDDI